MGTEIKRGKKVETKIAPSLYKKLKSLVKKQNTSVAQVLRDAIQAYVKK